MDMALPWILPFPHSSSLGFSKNHETLSFDPRRWLKDSRVGAQQPVLNPLTWQDRATFPLVVTYLPPVLLDDYPHLLILQITCRRQSILLYTQTSPNSAFILSDYTDPLVKDSRHDLVFKLRIN